MSINRLWMLGAAIVALGVVALGYFFGIAPQLTARGTALKSLASVQSTNAQLQAKVLKLAADSKNQSQLQSQLDALDAALPDSAATSAFVTELNAAAAGSRVTLSGITIADAQPYVAPAAPAAASGSSSSSSTPAPSPSPSAKSAAQPGMPPFTSSSVNASTMAVIPVTVTANGDYGSVLDFVKALQSTQRYLLVTSISTTQETGGGSGGSGGAAVSSDGVTATITGSIFSITGKAKPAAAPAPKH